MKFAQIGGASVTRRSSANDADAMALQHRLAAFTDLLPRPGTSGVTGTEWRSAGSTGMTLPASTGLGTHNGGEVDLSRMLSPFPNALPWIQARLTYPGWQAFLKRAIDIVVALVLIICAAPMMAIIAIAIKCTSRGPVIFRQERMGLHGKVFVVFKFRTMYAHLSDPLAARQTSAQDKRVTPLGRALRCTSLDELPQFFNVLLGDMSLVGPRPHALGTSIGGVPLEIADARYPLRHLVRPGITGWAQINGSRGALLSAEHLRRRLDHDLYYVQSFNTVLDLRIMFQTLVQLLTGFDGC